MPSSLRRHETVEDAFAGELLHPWYHLHMYIIPHYDTSVKFLYIIFLLIEQEDSIKTIFRPIPDTG